MLDGQFLGASACYADSALGVAGRHRRGAGILLGLFLGDDAHSFRPLGQVYVMLLEVAVYLYLICSLLHGLGSMASTQARRLFFSGLEILCWTMADYVRAADPSGAGDPARFSDELGGG